MKNLKSNVRLLALAVLTFIVAISLTSCDENPTEVTNQEILPESFGVDIPSSISNNNFVTGGRIGGRSEEQISGNEIYEGLSFFIKIGEGSAELIQELMTGIKQFDLENLRLVTYVSDDDNRTKTLTVEENVSFEGQTWEYFLNVDDVDENGGTAMQIFWNNDPVEGIAILNPYQIDRNENANAADAMYRIDYYENSTIEGYDAHMEVFISNLPAEEGDDFPMRGMQMIVGKRGDIVDVYGNSSHPDAILISDENEDGIGWAFVASGNDLLNIGVAEVGLPPATLNADSRAVLLEEYSIRNVFEREIEAEFGTEIPDDVFDAFLANTNPPGFFNSDGFVQAETAPSSEWDDLALRIQDLSPFNPLSVTNLEITFK